MDRMTQEQFEYLEYYLVESVHNIHLAMQMLMKIIEDIPAHNTEPLEKISQMLEGHAESIDKAIPILKEQVI